MAATTTADVPELPPGMDPAYYALSLLRRRKLEECVKVSAHHLTLPTSLRRSDKTESGATSDGALDACMWFIQTKALVLQSWYDDADIADDGVEDALVEGEQAVVSTAHRPNTSLRTARQATAGGSMANRAGRLGTSSGTSGRPVSSRYGYARPGTQQNRPGSVRGGPGGTAVRPVTGRLVRLGTASLQSVPGGPHINVQSLDLDRYAREKPMVAKLLCEYLLYVEHKPKPAQELCTAALRSTKTAAVAAAPASVGPNPRAAGEKGLPPFLPMSGAGSGGGSGGARGDIPASTPPIRPSASRQSSGYEQVGITSANDWWWKAQLAKANYQLCLLREAEKYLKAALFEGPVGAASGTGGTTAPGQHFVNYNTSVVMLLGKLYLRMDQPLTALEVYEAALQANPIDQHIILCCARLRDELHEPGNAFDLYNQVLHIDSSNVEAMACIGAHLFYERNQPELALRYYRRLLQMGVHSPEVWTNMGLCAFYTFQMDVSLSCLSRALTLCEEDSQRADVWYNVGHVGIGLGNAAFAERAFRLAVGADPTHAEALNNLAVLAHEKNKRKAGRRLLDTAVAAAPELAEALYNTAVVTFQAGELEVSYRMVMRVLETNPDHPEAIALQGKLRERFLAL